MNKVLSVLILLTVTGCSGKVQPEQWDKAEAICGGNGGIEHLRGSFFAQEDFLKCKNGLIMDTHTFYDYEVKTNE